MRRLSVAAGFVLLLAALRAEAACDVSSSGLAFGTVDLVRGTTTAGTITIDCDEPLSFQVALVSNDDGTGRIMRSPDGDTLRYDLFSGLNLLTPWGDGARLGPTVLARSDGGAAIDITVYGRIPPQTAEPGDYADQVIIEVIF